MRRLLLLLVVALAACAPASEPETVRFASINIEDIRTDDLRNLEHPRLKALAAQIQELKPDVVLVNEIAYDMPGAPGYVDGESFGLNAERFAANFLARPQGPTLQGIEYTAFMAPSNTGINSGFDLNRNGEAVTTYPEPPSAAADGTPASQTPGGRAYGDDSWGFGTFPGQYAMGLLVRTDRIELLADQARTFRRYPWAALPDARRPVDPATGEFWYPDEVWMRFPLSSKSHWDVPVRLPDGQIVHVLASHPTPAAFDGDEMRNKLRNHDEIRFWGAYIDGHEHMMDDAETRGGLAADAEFVIMGDLNADPDEGSSVDDPIGTWLLSNPRVNGDFVPVADEAGVAAYPDLDPDDTARWGLRVDYALPSAGLDVVGGGVYRPAADAPVTSDHFPVWIDVALRADQ
ncbi:MAG: endonuclease/exonuclease/phosphatase family protein [Rhodothermales bacterium]|nr:endonuclease/exonuclease/phosphatase family protein [Rhodothermales bacterium]MBO6780958.1 endonuclease/exonuclease/phosphatase family protein [Rhodothermales bacterium]